MCDLAIQLGSVLLLLKYDSTVSNLC